jgi:glycosyltransferase involved in cell wall biosynthesis
VRILFVTQQIDADHPVLAQTVDVVRELAGRCDALDVLCDSVGRHDLPANVRLRTFGARTRAGRGLRFVRAIAAALLPRSRPDAVLVHMVPLFCLLAAPIAKPLRVPLLLWYTHWRAGRSLRLALPLVDVVLSVTARSFPIATGKLRPTGHAIDVTRFVATERERSTTGPLRLVALGRTARWKGYDTMLAALEAAAARGCDAQLEIRGPELTGDERAHRRELEARVAASSVLRDRVRIEPPVPREELPALLAGADALISATQPRLNETLDKVVYEAAACRVPVLASNSALEEFLGGLPLRLRFPPGDADALAQLLIEFVATSPELREAAGDELRRRVVERHSLQSWGDAVTAVLADQRRQ